MSQSSLIFRSRNITAGLPLAYAFWSQRWEWENGPVVWGTAIALCSLGVGIRCWAVKHCGYGSGERKSLAVGGPYQFVRNPLYWGNLFVILAGVAASELFWLLAIAGPWSFWVFHVVVRGEESRLRRRFGAPYEAYLSRTSRWFPRMRSSPASGGEDLAPRHGAARMARQLVGFAVLIPFVVKELNLLGLWPHETKF